MKCVTCLIAILVVTIGCKKDSNPVGPDNTGKTDFNSTVLTGHGAFRYVLNGTVYNRKDAPTQYNAAASIRTGYLPRTKEMEIDLGYTSLGASLSQRRIALLFDYAASPLGIHRMDSSAIVIGTISVDTQYFVSLNGGNITITAIDSLNNTVTGSFAFAAALDGDPSPRDTIYGSFAEVSIVRGGYNEGTISAMVDGANIGAGPEYGNVGSATVTRTTSIGTLYTLQLFYGTLFSFEQLNIALPSLHPGVYSLGAVYAGVYSAAAYNASDGTATTESSKGATGTFTITAYDSLTHRFSGTFEFSGPNEMSPGDTIHVTDGTVDNVQWFDL
jgi:hypothetical protein